MFIEGRWPKGAAQHRFLGECNISFLKNADKSISLKQTIQKQRPTNHGMDQVWGSFRIKNWALYTLFASDRLTCSWFQWLLPLWRGGHYRG